MNASNRTSGTITTTRRRFFGRSTYSSPSRKILKKMSLPQWCVLGMCFLCILDTYDASAEDAMALDTVTLIAHRGVVTDDIPENSLLSLEETIRRGYTHIEVDLRSTKDGHAVCLHDASLERTTGLRHVVHELTLAELRALAPVEIVPDFASFCAWCEGRIELMVDIKACPPEIAEAYGKSIETAMVRHNLMKGAYFIGHTSLTQDFSERGRIAWRAPLEEVQADERAHNQPGDTYFIFNHAEDFDAGSVKAFQRLGLKVIVSINTFHYRGAADWQKKGDGDVARMLDYGVDGLQIDSVYEPAFRRHYKKRQRN